MSAILCISSVLTSIVSLMPCSFDSLIFIGYIVSISPSGDAMMMQSWSFHFDLYTSLLVIIVLPPIRTLLNFLVVLPIPLFLDSNTLCILLFLCFFLRNLLRGLELRRGFRLDAEWWNTAEFSCLKYLLVHFLLSRSNAGINAIAPPPLPARARSARETLAGLSGGCACINVRHGVTNRNTSRYQRHETVGLTSLQTECAGSSSLLSVRKQ